MSDRYDELRARYDVMSAAEGAYDDAQREYRDTVARLVQPGDIVRAFFDDAGPDEDWVVEGKVASVWPYHLKVADHRDSVRIYEVRCEDVFVVNDAHFLYDPDPDDDDDEPGNEPF